MIGVPSLGFSGIDRDVQLSASWPVENAHAAFTWRSELTVLRFLQCLYKCWSKHCYCYNLWVTGRWLSTSSRRLSLFIEWCSQINTIGLSHGQWTLPGNATSKVKPRTNNNLQRGGSVGIDLLLGPAIDGGPKQSNEFIVIDYRLPQWDLHFWNI